MSADHDNILTQQEYHILFEKGTEAPFSHPYNTLKKDGIFVCKNCLQPLFNSSTKYDSGSGWPSFYDALPNAIMTTTDTTHGMTRIEALCSHCQCHLGHIFPDGPDPTGMRYCINGTSLNFERDD